MKIAVIFVGVSMCLTSAAYAQDAYAFTQYLNGGAAPVFISVHATRAGCNNVRGAAIAEREAMVRTTRSDAEKARDAANDVGPRLSAAQNRRDAAMQEVSARTMAGVSAVDARQRAEVAASEIARLNGLIDGARRATTQADDLEEGLGLMRRSSICERR